MKYTSQALSSVHKLKSFVDFAERKVVCDVLVDLNFLQEQEKFKDRKDIPKSW